MRTCKRWEIKAVLTNTRNKFDREIRENQKKYISISYMVFEVYLVLKFLVYAIEIEVNASFVAFFLRYMLSFTFMTVAWVCVVGCCWSMVALVVASSWFEWQIGLRRRRRWARWWRPVMSAGCSVVSCVCWK